MALTAPNSYVTSFTSHTNPPSLSKESDQPRPLLSNFSHQPSASRLPPNHTHPTDLPKVTCHLHTSAIQLWELISLKFYVARDVSDPPSSFWKLSPPSVFWTPSSPGHPPPVWPLLPYHVLNRFSSPISIKQWLMDDKIDLLSTDLTHTQRSFEAPVIGSTGSRMQVLRSCHLKMRVLFHVPHTSGCLAHYLTHNKP